MRKSLFFAFLLLVASLVNAQERQVSQFDNANVVQANTHWQPIKPPGNTGMNMTIIAVVQFDGEEQFSSQLEVGAFHNGECRGAGLTNVSAFNRNFVFLTVYGLNGEEDTFKIYDHATGEELDMATIQSFTYVDNGKLGQIQDPYVINFIPNYFEITATADPDEGGVVSGAGIYNPETTAILTATPNVGYSFVNWTKDNVVVSTSATYSFTVTDNGNYVAHFSLNSYDITATANPTSGGVVSGAGTYTYGSSCSLTATANTGYTFVNWTKNGSVVSTNTTYNFTLTDAGDYVANFLLNNYDITATANPSEGGSVSGAGNYQHGSTVNLTATPAQYYYFASWTKNGNVVSTSATYSFTALESGNYVANFGIHSYQIFVSSDPVQGGTVTGSGSYTNGTSVTLTATPNTGYSFANWTKNGVVISTASEYNIVVTENASYIAHFNKQTFEITAIADPAQGGSISGAGTYEYGATCMLSATVNAGYSFVNWTKDDVVVSTSAACSFSVIESGNYVAHFLLNNFEITVSANPTIGGSVNGAGTYNYGATVTLTAIANDGFTFINWTKNGNEVSTNSTYSFMAVESGNFIANFMPHYNITVSANPTIGGTVSGGGSYLQGQTCTLTATANTGYTFVNWTKNGEEVSIEAMFSFEVDGSASYIANFTLNSYAITATANPAAGGTITGAGTYNHFATCTLTATANTGYTFVNWTKNGEEVSTEATLSFEVDGAASYVASFTLNSYAITATANPTVGGTVTGAGTYNHFATCTLTATANTGYTFVNWTKNGEEVSTEATLSFEVDGAASYVANFTLNSYAITATANPTVGGTVTGAGTYNHFATCTLTATANEGYSFVNWTKEGEEVSTEATLSFEVDGAASYVANFTLNSYAITATANPAAGGTITGAGTYDHFATCTLTATANTGYTFVNWTKNGEEVSTEATLSFEVDGAASYVASFTLNSYAITATANPTVGGTVTGAGTYNHFATCTLTATANTGYTFVNWTKNGEEVSTEATLSFEVDGAASYVANFTLNSYAITATANPAVGGTVTGAGTYNHFATCTLVATPNEYYDFINWTKDGEEVSIDATITFEVTDAAEYVANFEIDSYEISATVNPLIGGVITGAGTYDHFATCTLTATANVGYSFVNWTKEGEEVSTDAIFSFEVDGASSYVANFTLNSYAITATANPAGGGTITGAGTYNHFETCTLTATPATGYHFVNWTLEDEEVSAETVYSFEISGPATYVANFELNSYEITATTNPVTAGTVVGSGVYNHFETCTLTVIANQGYTFLRWIKEGEEVSTNTTISFTVTGAADYVAQFEINGYEVLAEANPEEGGTVSGTGVYVYDSEATLIATANEGYTFVNWTDTSGEEVSITETFTFTVTDNVFYNANFSLNSYEITAVANPATGGTITGAGTYDHFATCTLTATANIGYTFVNWTKGGEEVSTEAALSFEVDGPAEYVANFSLNSYEITAIISPTVGGTITGAGTYDHFATCTLTAIANTGYTFINWTKDDNVVSTESTLSFEVDGPAEYVANFTLNSYVITATANPSVGGMVTGAGTYNHFTTCTLVATPNEYYHFINWTKNGVVVSTETTYSFEVDSSASYVANFNVDSYSITAVANPEEGGTIIGAGIYDHFATCTLAAIANAGYTFINWTKNGEVVSVENTISFNVDGAASYIANFSLNNYDITAIAIPEIGGSVSGSGTYNHFETCTLTATPSLGYHFVNWTLDGQEVSVDATYSFEVDGPAAYVANFGLNSYTITAIANPTVGGTITGTGTYNHFDTCVLTATANTGYTFVNWTKDGVEVSTNATISFEVDGVAAYVANFSLNSYVITATATPMAGGTVAGGGIYNHFDYCTLTATPAIGYHFINWTLNGQVVSTEFVYTFMVSNEGDYVANFEINSYEITATLNPADAGTITGAGTYNHFQMCTLTAMPTDDYLFVNWTQNGIEVSTNTTISFEVTSSASYVANFVPNAYEITASATPSYAGDVSGGGVYNYNTQCTLTATANYGFSFVNWTKDGVVVSTDAEYTFLVVENASYIANFASNQYTVVAMSSPVEGGTTTGDGTYIYGATCVLTASANEGYHFINWTDEDNNVLSSNFAYLFNVTDNTIIIAHFGLNTYTISAFANPTEGGVVEGAGVFDYGESCTLTATAAEGYSFVNWTLDGEEVSTFASYTFYVNDNASYVANFEIESYVISAVANPEDGGYVAGAGTYYYGESCTLTATAANGYNFINWTNGDEIITTNNMFTFTVTENADYVANFEEIIINTYEVTVTASPEGYGVVTGGGTYTEGEICVVVATPTEGHMFIHWMEAGIVVSEEAEYSFVVTENHNFVAIFDVDGINEYGTTTFVMYPNPVIDKVMVESSEFINKCEIYSINGSLIYTINECSESFEINVGNYVSGSYVIRLISNTGVQTRVLIKE